MLVTTLYLADFGFGTATILAVPPAYPTPIVRAVRNFAVNISSALSGGTTVNVLLLKNGVAVPGFALTFVASGIQSVVVGPVAFAVNDTIDVQVNGAGPGNQTFNVSAMIGVE